MVRESPLPPRRSALQLALALLAPSASHAASQAAPVGYRSLRLRGAQNAPVSLWYPTRAKGAVEKAPYRHYISVARIVELLQGAQLPNLGWEFRLKADSPIQVDAPFASDAAASELQLARARHGAGPARCAVVFAHGYLGSRFDMLHLCERLAQKGFVVAAPDFPEGLSGAVPLGRVNRQLILEELISRLRREFGVEHLGIVGHSAGGGTATVSTMPFRCGRVAVAGLAAYAQPDPLLVVASEGDGVVPLGRVLKALPPDALSVEAVGAADVAAHRRLALLLRSGKGRGRAPCHISFLSAESNEAMVTLLSPLLPVARALRVPVLDFDTYLSLRDGPQVAEQVLPLIEDFFFYHAARAV
ncbi:unnamed protein product [Effrenium voratum]|uniref:1-alkyl-2-acetylglycerophosphocholine esterase n=1 Tax=Effrenium voratum TaxID=2562239 RepID=A0AA36NC29_9DINO|nr:unnamed protein product [Effrenium voratum]